jgi:hypothetical protein
MFKVFDNQVTHDSEYWSYGLLVCDDIYSERQVPTFQRLSSTLKMEAAGSFKPLVAIACANFS